MKSYLQAQVIAVRVILQDSMLELLMEKAAYIVEIQPAVRVENSVQDLGQLAKILLLACIVCSKSLGCILSL